MQIRIRLRDGSWIIKRTRTRKPLVDFIDHILTSRVDEIRNSRYYCIVFSKHEEKLFAQRVQGIIGVSEDSQAYYFLHLFVEGMLAQRRENPGQVSLIPRDPNSSITEAKGLMLAYVLKNREPKHTTT